MPERRESVKEEANRGVFRLLSDFPFACVTAWAAAPFSVDDQMTQEDISYYRQRAEREMALAQEARHPLAARAHDVLARHYLDMIEGGVLRPFREPRAGLGMFPRTG